MFRRSLRAATTTATLCALVVGVMSAPAVASCAADPDALRFREMIDQDTTGHDDFPIMFLGAVTDWYDLGGKPGGGRAVARLAVAEHPVGSAPLVSDVRFWRNYPGVGSSGEFELKRDGRYVVIARRLDDGTYAFDGACGQSRRLNRERFRDLVRYARTH
jgi:hypothetical protein